jgi:superfamily I DNA and RNA helicase
MIPKKNIGALHEVQPVDDQHFELHFENQLVSHCSTVPIKEFVDKLPNVVAERLFSALYQKLIRTRPTRPTT